MTIGTIWRSLWYSLKNSQVKKSLDDFWCKKVWYNFPFTEYKSKK